MKHYVYTLAYPDGKVFYVGKGKGNRINQHEKEARQGKSPNNHKINVIRKIWRAGGQIVKTILAYFEIEQDAFQYEIALIFFMDGLTNLTYGGDGLGLSEETKQKISEKNKGHFAHPMSEELKQKLIEANRKRDHTPSEETRRKISKTLEGQKKGPLSEETKHKMSEAQKGRAMPEARRIKNAIHLHKINESRIGKPGRHPTEETRRKISETQKGRPSPAKGKPLSEEHRVKLALAHMGKKQSPETIAKRIAKVTGKKRTEAQLQNLRGRIPWNKGKRLPKRNNLQLEFPEMTEPFSEQIGS